VVAGDDVGIIKFQQKLKLLTTLGWRRQLERGERRSKNEEKKKEKKNQRIMNE